VVLHYSFESLVSYNNIEHNYYGIVSYYSSRNNFYGNNIIANYYGVYIEEHSSNSKFYHNNIVANEFQAVVHIPYLPGDFWDDGYPSGGNYWSDYIDVDQYSGPNQDQPGSDGIWDHPYVINENNIDHYPLVNPWTPTPSVQTWLFDSDFQYNLDDDYGTVEGTGHLTGNGYSFSWNLNC
jgi:parallel beta-helix repeat protein